MTKRGYILVAVFTLIVNVLFAQSPYTVKAYEFYTQGEYELASKSIDQAVKETDGINDPLAWQIRAIIYFEMYSKVEGKSNVSESRIISLQSTLHSIELDENKDILDQNNLLLERLSKSYFNDAVIALNNLDADDPFFAKNSFDEYIRIQKFVNPDVDLSSKQIEFYRAQATAFGNLYLIDPVINEVFYNYTLESLGEVFQIDSMDYGANYNMGIYLFNEGVYKIEAINSVIDIREIVIIEKTGIDLFKKAEPYMLRAHDLIPREETLKGLKLIYRSLNDIDKYEYYSNELDLFLENNKE